MMFHNASGKMFYGQMREKCTYAQRYVLMKKNTAQQQQNLITIVKHGKGSIMVFDCFAASGSGRLAIIQGAMNTKVY